MGHVEQPKLKFRKTKNCSTESQVYTYIQISRRVYTHMSSYVLAYPPRTIIYLYRQIYGDCSKSCTISSPCTTAIGAGFPVSTKTLNPNRNHNSGLASRPLARPPLAHLPLAHPPLAHLPLAHLPLARLPSASLRFLVLV